MHLPIMWSIKHRRNVSEIMMSSDQKVLIPSSQLAFFKKKRRFNDPVIGEPNIWNLRRRISRTIKSFCDGRYAHTQGREIDSGNAMILSPSFLAAPPCASTHAAPLPNFGFFPSNRNKIVTSCDDSCWWGSCWWDSCW